MGILHRGRLIQSEQVHTGHMGNPFCEQTDRQTARHMPLKTLPSRNYLCGQQLPSATVVAER